MGMWFMLLNCTLLIDTYRKDLRHNVRKPRLLDRWECGLCDDAIGRRWFFIVSKEVNVHSLCLCVHVVCESPKSKSGNSKNPCKCGWPSDSGTVRLSGSLQCRKSLMHPGTSIGIWSVVWEVTNVLKAFLALSSLFVELSTQLRRFLVVVVVVVLIFVFFLKTRDTIIGYHIF